MNIAVCIKQTPIPAEARFDEKTKRLIREGVTLSISSIDRRALLEALRLRSLVGGTVTVVTMGPPQARSALVEALGLGADKAIHLTDRAFAGADTLATARALGAALRRIGPDLVMCGKFSVDSETGQVPSEVAELLGWPQITCARAIQPTERPNVLWVEREMDEGYERYEVALPALLSVAELIITGRRPTPEELQEGEKKPIEVWTAADLDLTPSLVGEAGSPTRVAEIRSAGLERSARVLSESDTDVVAQVMDYLLQHGLFRPRQQQGSMKPRRATPSRLDPTKAIWVVAELVGGEPRRVTYELLGKAQELADRLKGEVAAVLVGGPDVAGHVAALGAYGADAVYLAAGSTLATYDTLAYTEVLASAIRRYQPYLVLLPSTTNGRDWAPRVAARLGLGLTGDCVELEFGPDSSIAQIKPAFGGNIVSPIYSATIPVMATVRPGMLEVREPRWDAPPRVVPLEHPQVDSDSRVRLVEYQVDQALGATQMDDADVVVGVGMGVGQPEGVAIVRELAAALDGAMAASLRVATAKWLPPQLQLGLTGRAVAPIFYIAVGISGQPNHLIGAKKAQHIIAINKDPQAPIFKSADLGVVGDWATIVPALTRAVRKARESARD